MRVDENAQWRRPQLFGAHRPALDGWRWLIKWINRPRPCLPGNRIDDAPGPTVKRVRIAINERLEGPPHGRTGIADQNEL